MKETLPRETVLGIRSYQHRLTATAPDIATWSTVAAGLRTRSALSASGWFERPATMGDI